MPAKFRVRRWSYAPAIAVLFAMAAVLAASPGAGVRVMNTVPRFRLQSQDGQPFGSMELDGKVWIATFIFTRCAQTCPLQTAAMSKLQKSLSDHPRRGDIHFVSVTIDPDHDTAPVLAEYARAQGAGTASWTFLTGPADQIRSLMADGFRLPPAGPDPGAPPGHSQSLILVDRARRVRGHYDALDDGARARLQRDLDAVLDDPPGPITKSKDLDKGAVFEGRAYVPGEIRDPSWMKDRADAQLARAHELRVDDDFRFVDTLPESGITFKNRVVEDGGLRYKGVHYDHGNGLAVADVDGDGRLDIYFVNQLGPNQLVRNLGAGQFKDATTASGVGMGDRQCVTASFADIDNDGDPDLYVTAVRKGNVLFENMGKGVFRDITAASGLGHKGHSSAAVFFDYDKDGLVDLFLTNVGNYTTDEIGPGGYYVGRSDAFSGQLYPERSEASILFRNAGNRRFVDVSESTGLTHTGWTGAATPADVNEDGWPDLYVLSMQGHDEYYENVEGRRFIRKSREIFPETPWGSMGVKSFDVNNDGKLDLYITDMHTDMVDDLFAAQRFWYAEKLKMTELFPPRFLNTDGRHILGNALFLKEGPGRFREASDEFGAENYWPWGLSTGDLNADGYEDVFVTAAMNYPYRYAVNSLLLNDLGERLVDSEFILGAEPRRGGRTSSYWFTLDCAVHTDHFACQQPGARGRIDVFGALGSRSSAIFDLEWDGDLDIVTNDFHSEPMVLKSDLAARRKKDLNYLVVDLAGTKSNRGGLGAVVRVSAGGKTYLKVQDGQSGYLSQSAMPLYFGLGKAQTVDEVQVVWPSSWVQTIPGPIKSNFRMTVKETSPPPPVRR